MKLPEERLEPHNGRWPNVLNLRYMAQFRLTRRMVERLGVRRLARMSPAARRVACSEIHWAREHRGFIPTRGLKAIFEVNRPMEPTSAMWRAAFAAMIAVPLEEFQGKPKKVAPIEVLELPVRKMPVADVTENVRVARLMELAEKVRVA